MPVTTSPVLTPMRTSISAASRSSGCGAHGAQRVVLADGRHAEDGHHGVADELLDRAAVPLDRGARDVEVARHQRAQRLGVEPLAERGRAGDVAEEHGHDLPLLARPAPTASAAPQTSQKRAPARFSAPQTGQITARIYP